LLLASIAIGGASWHPARTCETDHIRSTLVGMRVGVFLLGARFSGTSNEQAIEDTLAYGIAAERAGFDDAFVAEHHFMPYGTCPSAVTFAALLAGRTTRIGVGTAVSVVSTVHPVALGEQAAMLDRLTGGRFTLGVGRGGPWVDLEVFGTGPDRQSPAAFAEALEVLTAWLTSESVSYDGEFHRFREVAVVPRPRTGGSPPPVLVACTSPETVALAAKHQLPMLLGMHATDEEKRAMIDLYGAAAPHVSVLVAQTAPSRAEAVSLLRRTMPLWLRDGLAAHVRFDATRPPMRDPDAYARHLADIHPVGDPAYCAERILESAEATGVDRVLLFVEGGGPEHTLRNIETLGAEVLPRLRAFPGPRHGPCHRPPGKR
jgi:alkanesulfonate monooxygenase SsuD/methylene tetrahydromethanopterin reductase-like flavin-dependent oxidoreductase (luciferase family)